MSAVGLLCPEEYENEEDDFKSSLRFDVCDYNFFGGIVNDLLSFFSFHVYLFCAI